jgi:phosphoribosylformylglycinamidine cyclo-ligase
MTEEKGGTSKYAQLGVDAGKQDVRNTFLRYIENDYPRAFVNIIRDPSNPGWVETQHMDGDGSKFVQRLLNFAETGDPQVIRGAVDDALQMNLGDIAASGFVFGRIIVTDVINVNGLTVPKKIITDQISQRFAELLQMYKDNGFDIHWLGGETADLPTQVKSITFDVAVHARAKESDIIKGNIEPGDRIYGFASDGRAAWETAYNTGIMSNGLTLARTGTIWSGYEEKYPQLGPQHGKYKVGEKAGLPNDMAVSDALISPTRQWAILIKMLLEKLKATDTLDYLHGISMNTGGGATKISNVGKGIVYRKNMPTLPEFFQFLQRETGENWKDMFRVFNCGVGLDVVGEDTPRFREMLRTVSLETKVKLYELGKCEASNDGENHVILETPHGSFNY